MMTIYNYLQAILISGFWTLDDLNEWIINVLSNNNCERFYELYDLLYVNDKEIVTDRLAYLRSTEDYWKYNKFSITYVVLGYYYWQYVLGKIELRQCLTLCGEYSDGVGTGVDCTEFYDLIDKNDDEIISVLKILCEEPFVEAKRQYKLIQQFIASNF